MTIKGEITKLIEDPNFVNCTVKLAQPMPPSGAETTFQLNTAQVEKSGGSKGGESKGAQQSQSGHQGPQPAAASGPAQQQAPSHAAAKK